MAIQKPVKAPVETKKTSCPITAEEFAQHAPALAGQIQNGSGAVLPLFLLPKTFSTGSFGWHSGEKMTLVINGKPIKVQANVLLTVVGSKDLAK